jgi:hypothetical protein
MTRTVVTPPPLPPSMLMPLRWRATAGGHHVSGTGAVLARDVAASAAFPGERLVRIACTVL